MARRMTTEEMDLRLSGRAIEILAYGKNVRAQTTFRCLVDGCGHEWETAFASVDDVKGSGTGCPECGLRKKSHSNEDVAKMLAGRQICVENYGGSITAKSNFRCTADGCGYEWVSTLKNIHHAGFGCPKCSGTLPLSEDDARAYLSTKAIGIVEYSGKMSTHSKLKCLVDGYEWTNSVTNIKIGNGCPKCAGVLPPTIEDVQVKLEGSGIAILRYGGFSSGSGTFKCLKEGCGHEWDAKVSRVMRGASGCPSCANYGFSPSRPAVFYIYCIHQDQQYIGFGISNNFAKRHSKHNCEFTKAGAIATLIRTYETTGEIAQEFERVIKRNFPIVDTGIPGFRTEAILYDDESLAVICHGAEHARRLSTPQQIPQHMTQPKPLSS